MSTSTASDSDQRTSRRMGLEERTSGGSNSSDIHQKSGLLDIDLHVNKTFSTSIARILTVNDMYGNRVLRETILDEVGDLCRFTKKLCRSQSVGM